MVLSVYCGILALSLTSWASCWPPLPHCPFFFDPDPSREVVLYRSTDEETEANFSHLFRATQLASCSAWIWTRPCPGSHPLSSSVRHQPPPTPAPKLYLGGWWVNGFEQVGWLLLCWMSSDSGTSYVKKAQKKELGAMPCHFLSWLSDLEQAICLLFPYLLYHSFKFALLSSWNVSLCL